MMSLLMETPRRGLSTSYDRFEHGLYYLLMLRSISAIPLLEGRAVKFSNAPTARFILAQGEALGKRTFR